jgi:hypothetical protein
MGNLHIKFNELTQDVVDKIGDPVSPIEVVACLESFGIRDKDVFNDYGFVSLTDLAKGIYDDLSELRLSGELVNEKEREKITNQNDIPVSDYLIVKARIFGKYYPLGLFHILPVFIQIAAIVLFGYSLWTFLGFNIVQSTAVVLGVVLGLVFSGGYVQVMGRQASFYWDHAEYAKAKLVVDKITYSGVSGMLRMFVVLFLINFLFNLYPFAFVSVVVVYTFLIGLLLLVMAPFHTMKQRWGISLAVTIATLCALGLHAAGVWVYLSHWIGILLAILVSKILLHWLFKKKKALEKPNIKPKKLVVIYRNYPYFFYGMGIYAFIFLDRILAWTANTGITHRFMLLYEKDYEIGMDLAILMFFLLAGVMEFSIAAFSKFMDIRQKNTGYLDVAIFNKAFQQMYIKHMGLLVVSAVAAASFIYWVATSPMGYASRFDEPLESLSLKVCLIGVVGYLFLSWGMLNSLYLFTLNKPKPALTSLLVGFVTNFALGFALSRWVSYEYSAIGMLLGAITFGILSCRQVLAFFKELDYHYYAAY